jgi:zinc protease
MKFLFWMMAATLTACATGGTDAAKGTKGEYVVMASRAVVDDESWNRVAEALRDKREAKLLIYEATPGERAKELRDTRPRYVAVVEKPERLDRDFIIEMHQMSRTMDDDIFADFLWGAITGYDAATAMNMVTASARPLVIKNAVATITELREAKWFDRYAWVDDHEAGLWGEKLTRGGAVTTGQVAREEVLRKFSELYATFDPDLVVTAAHATENNLEMPFSLGNLKARDGLLYAEDRFSGKTWDVPGNGKRKIYFAVGNCLIGNVNRTNKSMAIAWMKGGNAATMIGYVVPTWHGRNGWGGLKYWLATPGRYTLAEAIYLNQQDFLFQGNAWHPLYAREPYPHERGPEGGLQPLTEALGRKPTADQLGFWHDRDVLAYYGDPLWDARLQEVEGENDFTVTLEGAGKRRAVVVKTGPNFSMKQLAGGGFKEEHVLDLPFSYFFPERLRNPRPAKGEQSRKMVVDENFLLVYDPDFQPSREYRIALEVD